MRTTEQERTNRLLGLLASLGVHLVLIILFIFVMGFVAPDPPLGELGSGVELQLGVDDQGSGDVQQEVPISPEEATEDAKTEEVKKEQTPQEEQIKTQPEPPAQVKPDENLSSEEESPVTVKEVKKEQKKEKPVEPTKEKVTPKVKDVPVAETKKEEKKEVKKEEAETGKKDGISTGKTSKGLSQGDDKGKTGDKGVPEGVPDLKAQYTGKAGSGGDGNGGGGGISMTGFNGFARPDIVAPEVPEDSYGTYEFVVKVNSQGEIEKITPKTRGLSLEAENIFKKVIQNLDFVPLNSNLPAFSEGTITFKIVAGKK